MINEAILKAEYEKAKKFTIGFKDLTKAEREALDLSKSACNINGYILNLENRVKSLEQEIKLLKEKK